ncbi:ABC transporter permease [Microbacterium sp. Au-Mic1]|uniref:ABC transporter permease n=1 Tax=Microbacterium sp. Au-Mic1 TaxID=2906457 RepID=UPI001E3FD190|nr:ABC transporter permease [Microbacterium sp. Au-Mic1]MCE4026259.1 ABC transporter permease [Microbacterium sp. Au-Mic1]
MTSTTALPEAPGVRAPARAAGFIREYGILVALVVVIIVMSLLSPHFLTYANAMNILTQMSILGILAVGTTLLLITGSFDLSIGSTLGLAGALTLGLSAHMPLMASIGIALAAGLLVGLVNGFIVVKAGINSLIVTLGTMSLVRGLVLIYTNGTSIQGDNIGFQSFVNTTSLIPNIAWGLLIVAAIMATMLTQTRTGRYFTAAGGNAEAAEVSGINVDAYKIAAFAVMGLLAGFAGVLYAGRVNSVDPTAGTGFELQAIAAVIIGGTSLAGGSGSVWKSIVGAALLTTLNNGFNLLNIGSYYQGVIQGAVIILSVAVYTRRTRR